MYRSVTSDKRTLSEVITLGVVMPRMTPRTLGLREDGEGLSLIEDRLPVQGSDRRKRGICEERETSQGRPQGRPQGAPETEFHPTTEKNHHAGDAEAHSHDCSRATAACPGALWD